ncbi:interactor of constitutive active ROPs 2, chloroplastic-like isoform X2 [Amaranthus tricolor]|uniref:interactor of constitutive active ROPs 2, chloroplastic-like isoform X2 n=1 Tax=Amaranthus tricolor TaxID=29722 RepID=UPI002583BF80|nr:interactor of constitutive active ROPs 2, chloroplastic-like isoform X2 [Amaranthus tricolor]
MKPSQMSSPSSILTTRKLRVTGSCSSSTASPTSLSRTQMKRSPKVLERGSQRTPITKHTASKLSELESQLSQLKTEIERSKDELSSSEALTLQAQKEAEDTKEQLLVMSVRLKESEHHLMVLTFSEDSRVNELHKLSQERDQVWQSELEAIQKQHSMNSMALASALKEIQKLNRQLETVAESEAAHSMRAESAHVEIEKLHMELSEAFLLVENTRKQINECKDSEFHAMEKARESKMQIEETMRSVENLRVEGLKAKEDYNSLVSELKQSKGEAASLETLVKELEKDLKNMSQNWFDTSEETVSKEDRDDMENENNVLEVEIDSLKLEIRQLNSALEASELRYVEEYIQSTLQIRSTYDQLERVKSDSSAKEAEYEAEVKKARYVIEELKAEMVTKETMMKNMSENNKELTSKIEEIKTSPKEYELEEELKKLNEYLEDLKVDLIDKETLFQYTHEENEMLQEEIRKIEKARSQAMQEAATKESARVCAQLDAALAEKGELEAELRRLKVQTEQWRKAAEAAVSMLSCKGNNVKLMDRSVSLNCRCNSLVCKSDSPLSDDFNDESSKKRNGNVLKKIGGLWKNG